MPGPRIMHYMIDVGYIEPTRVYAVVQLPNSDLRMDKIAEFKDCPIDYIVGWYSSLDIKRPIVLVNPHPEVLRRFRMTGAKVR